MSENEHAKAIRRATSTTSMVLADRWSRDSKDRVRLQLDSIERHADALAAQLAEAEARAARFRTAFLWAEAGLEMYEPQQDQTREAWLERWGLHHGDLPDAESETQS